MEPLGFYGIIKLTTQIIHTNLKHFLCIALLLAIPNAFLLAIAPPPSSAAQSLTHSISLLYNYTHGKIPSPPYTPTQPQPQLQPYSLLLLNLAIFVFATLYALCTQPLLTFSVCRAVLNKSLSFKSSLLAVPRSALSLIVTMLCVAGVLLGLSVAMVILLIIVAAGLCAMSIDPTIAVAIWSVIMIGGWLYLAVVWSLANTVAIVEEKRGWEAMKRSMYLVDGSKWVVFSLTVVFGVWFMFLPITASEKASVMWRWSCEVLSLGLQTIIALFSMASMVVLYLSCKSRFKEPLDTLIALSAEFGPQETSAKYMDLESAHFVTS